jgi:hypothetical protein
LKETADVDEETVIDSAFNCLQHPFLEAMRAKLRVYSKIAPFYAGYWFRKRKLNAYFNGQRMLETFGAPRHVVLAAGDWEQRPHCKFKEPTRGKTRLIALRASDQNRLIFICRPNVPLSPSLGAQRCAICHAGRTSHRATGELPQRHTGLAKARFVTNFGVSRAMRGRAAEADMAGAL